MSGYAIPPAAGGAASTWTRPDLTGWSTGPNPNSIKGTIGGTAGAYTIQTADPGQAVNDNTLGDLAAIYDGSWSDIGAGADGVLHMRLVIPAGQAEGNSICVGYASDPTDLSTGDRFWTGIRRLAGAQHRPRAYSGTGFLTESASASLVRAYLWARVLNGQIVSVGYTWADTDDGVISASTAQSVTSGALGDATAIKPIVVIGRTAQGSGNLTWTVDVQISWIPDPT